jgi:hypothetical protein
MIQEEKKIPLKPYMRMGIHAQPNGRVGLFKFKRVGQPIPRPRPCQSVVSCLYVEEFFQYYIMSPALSTIWILSHNIWL